MGWWRLPIFWRPYGEHWNNRALANSPPTAIQWTEPDSGQLTWPYVSPMVRRFNPDTYEFTYQPDARQRFPIQFWVHGEPYDLFGLIHSDVHLFGLNVPANATTQLTLLGTDQNGRDNFSRLLFGGQVSLTIGFLSLLIVFPLGLLYGGLSGYVGGWVDNLMMRLTEVLMSIPSLYLLIGLAALLPAHTSSVQRFAMVTLILSFIGWAPLSRVIRGMVLSIKQLEFIEASRAIGLGALPIVIKHVLPQTTSYVIVALTLSVPGYILAESGLSFLGLGIQQPDASWGNMLKEAQDITNVLGKPWMLTPGFLIFIAVLCFNVVGDAVRDVLDPKKVSS
jgi:peptide/nickel transport system permease protein